MTTVTRQSEQRQLDSGEVRVGDKPLDKTERMVILNVSYSMGRFCAPRWLPRLMEGEIYQA